MEFIDSNKWVPVHTLAGYECCIEYYVNDKGDVKSTKGTIERILKPRKNKSGYSIVKLTQRIGRKGTKTVYVHQLVALAFLETPPMPPGRTKGCCIVKHKDGDTSNSSASNLQWVKRLK